MRVRVLALALRRLRGAALLFIRADRFLEVWKREGGVWQVQHIVTLHDPTP